MGPPIIRNLNSFLKLYWTSPSTGISNQVSIICNRMMGEVTENRDARTLLIRELCLFFSCPVDVPSRVKRVQHSRKWWIIKNEKAFELIKIWKYTRSFKMTKYMSCMGDVILWSLECHHTTKSKLWRQQTITQTCWNILKKQKKRIIIADEKCIALTEWHVFYIRDDLSIIQEYLKKNNNFKWYGQHVATAFSAFKESVFVNFFFSANKVQKLVGL